jgi:alpha-tubulin suppressor-like RCC1 family protein
VGTQSVTGALAFYPTPLTATIPYAYFRLVVNTLNNANGYFSVAQWLLYSGSVCSSTPVRPSGCVRNVCSATASVDTTYVEAVLGREMVAYNSATSTVPVYTKVRSYGLFEMASGEDVISPGCETGTSTLVTKGGAAHAWGLNTSGQVGNGTVVNTLLPVAITAYGSLSSASSVVAAASGNVHTVALDSGGRVHAWGANASGQLGNSTLTTSTLPLLASAYGTLAAAGGIAAVAVACGYVHTVVLDSRGKVHSWGGNGNGQLGIGTLVTSTIPVGVAFGSIASLSIAAIACGAYHAVAVDTTGKVHTWGYNVAGQLGNGTVTTSSIPVAVGAFGSLASVVVGAVACGGSHTVAIDSTGKVHAWGQNSTGQLGNGATTLSMSPIAVSSYGSILSCVIVGIACGDAHTVALDAGGRVHAWGQNTYGKLGTGTTVNSLVPVAIQTGSLASVTVVSVACGLQHTLALDSTGKVHAWGYDAYGQLGSGATTNTMVPVQITGVYGSLAAASVGSIFWNFTGQHRCFVEGYSAKDLPAIEGLVVCADRNRYVTTDAATGDHAFLTGARAITTNDALPVLSLARKAQDKSAFGVVSLSPNYSPAPDPTEAQLRRALEEGDQRAEINAVGEGAMWVCDACAASATATTASGTLAFESGDYITTSAVPGYGQRQTEPYMCNYTVAKVTMDCDFAAPLVPVLKLRKDAFGNNATDATTGMPVYDPVLTDPTVVVDPETGVTTVTDPGGTPVMEPAYKTRFLTADGTQITAEEYTAIVASPEYSAASPVYRAAFVGCTYHCG